MQRTTAITALLAFCGAAPADVQFFSATDYEPSGSEPRRVVIAQLNEDAHPDVFVWMSADGEVAMRFGDSAGAFPVAMVTDDLDADGDPDLAVDLHEFVPGHVSRGPATVAGRFA